MKAPFEAVAVRYVADVSTGEFLNIGVVLVCPQRFYARALFVSSWDRIISAFPQADPAHLRAVASVFERTCEAWMGRARQLGKATTIDMVLRSAIHPDDGSIKFSPSMSGVTADPDRLLKELYAKYAGHLAEVRRSTQEPPATWMHQVIAIRNVARLATNHAVATGAVNMAGTYQLAAREETGVQSLPTAEAGAWEDFDRVELLHGPQGMPLNRHGADYLAMTRHPTVAGSA